MAKLVVHTGPQAGAEFSLDRSRVSLGRSADSDVVLEDQQASRHQAEIIREEDQLIIRDLDSMNGTFVNGQRLTDRYVLRSGDQIQIGKTMLSCEAGTAAGNLPAVSDWEAQLWVDDEIPAPGRQRRMLLLGLGGVLAALIVVAAVSILLVTKSPPVAETIAEATTAIPTSVPASPIVVVPTQVSAPTLGPSPSSAPSVSTATPLPTTEPAPTVELVPTRDTVPALKPTPVPIRETSTPRTAWPTGRPVAPEELPSVVSESFPGVPAEQVPQAIAEQIQALPPEQLQAIVDALFPGIPPDVLPQVIAASFPGISGESLQALLSLVFPGQTIPLPTVPPVSGRLALGIYDPGREQYDLYFADASGGRPVRLLEQAADPDFAPDGRHIVYHSWKSDQVGLRIVETSGANGHQLTAVDTDGYPSFDPDGDWVSFFNAGNRTLHLIEQSGQQRRDIGQGEYPDWSPSGSQIVYRGCVGGGRCGLVVSGADGSNPRQITTYANDAAPRWSPNGGQIAFMSDRDGNWEIYVINSDGSWLRRITSNAASDIMPVWSPDGLRIAFRSDREGKWMAWVTSGIGGPASRMFEAETGPGWIWARMDWKQ